MNKKYTPNNYDKAIRVRTDGFEFGEYILAVGSDSLNAPNKGWCDTGKV